MKRILSIITALVLSVCLFPSNVYADVGPTTVTYLDADSLQAISGLVLSDQEQFIIEQPDGTSFAVGSHVYIDGEGFYINLGERVTDIHTGVVTQAGKHILKSFPIPNGYKVLEVYSINETWDDSSETFIREKVNNGFFSYPAEIYILLMNTEVAPTDKPSSWAVDQVNAAIGENLVPQSLQSKYTQATTRAEFCALAVALYEKISGETIPDRKTFDDTKDVNVEKMAALGVVNGIGNNKFAPDDKLTREQAAVMLSRLCDAIDDTLLGKWPPYFDDNDSISSWAFESVGRMQGTGIMQGVGNNKFTPKEPYTREQSIITILRMFSAIKNVEKESSIPSIYP